MAKIFLTGKQNVGKSTIIDRVVAEMSKTLVVGGFRTFLEKEFSPCKRYAYLRDIDDDKETYKIALIDRLKHKVVSYPSSFDTFGIEILNKSSDRDLIVMDELGFMEINAFDFQNKIMELLGRDINILGVVRLDSNPFLDKIKTHPEVKIFEVISGNRDALPRMIIERFKVRQ